MWCNCPMACLWFSILLDLSNYLYIVTLVGFMKALGNSFTMGMPLNLKYSFLVSNTFIRHTWHPICNNWLARIVDITQDRECTLKHINRNSGSLGSPNTTSFAKQSTFAWCASRSIPKKIWNACLTRSNIAAYAYPWLE